MTGRRAGQWAGYPVEALRKRWGRNSVHAYGKVDSTNAVARELAESGEPAGTVIVAREQTAGKGRGDRRWFSPPGGLYLSMIFRPDGGGLAPLTSVLAALGVAQELDRAIPGLLPRLKWPNDIVTGGRKLGGVLPEATSGEQGIRYLVVGVGINVKPLEEGSSKDLVGRVASVSEAVSGAADMGQVADAVVAGLEKYLSSPPTSADGAILDVLDQYDWLRGRRVRVRQAGPAEGIRGVSVGIAPDGALLFRPDQGALRRCSSGSVEVEQE